MTAVIRFSICIPVYNRERLITRAIASCLIQNGADFEIVVIDDGSSDGSVAAIEAMADERIRLRCLGSNRGMATARNTAIAAARGEWIVTLDSDDELLPGGLDRIREVVESGATDVDCYEFMYQRDDGCCSPDPPLVDRRIDFQDYLGRLDRQRFFDSLHCLRRSAALQTPWREWKVAGVILHSLEVHHTYRCADVSSAVALIHTDADNRISWVRRGAALARRAGQDLGEELDLIFARYGAELRCWAPLTWRRYQRVRASYFFLAGCRRSGVWQSLRCLSASPLSADVWASLIFGLTGPHLYARIRAWRRPPT
jgi:glycosyltransferase involved in cell wall biosynthesis